MGTLAVVVVMAIGGWFEVLVCGFGLVQGLVDAGGWLTGFFLGLFWRLGCLWVLCLLLVPGLACCCVFGLLCWSL